MRSHTLLFLLIPGSISFNIPFKLSKIFSHRSYEDQFDLSLNIIETIPRIAIIGAGAGGSSAAFWIEKARERFGLEVEVDVYEQSDYIGGRSTVVYPYGNSSLPEIELGASIFVKANKNLWRASDEFNLTRIGFKSETDEIGVWDGENILITLNGGWSDVAKVIWRYGFFAVRRTQALVAAAVEKLLHLYSADTLKWDNINDLSDSLGFTELTSSTGLEYLINNDVSEAYGTELVEAGTRVNYGQNIDEIHALGTMVSLASDNAVGIEGGNYRIFEQFLKRSSANVYLNTTVSSILPTSSSHHWTLTSPRGSTVYKAVILAAPFHFTNITLPHAVSTAIPEQPYQPLHVTLLTTTSPTPNPEYFGLKKGDPVPRMMLTSNQGARKGGKAPQFNSISYHGAVREGEWAVKIFSDMPVSNEWLSDMFDGKVGWVHRKNWNAYPKLHPTVSFPPVKLGKGLYYINAFEPFISTMETETIASRNVVDLLLSDEFQSSICGKTLAAADVANITSEDQPSETTLDNFVIGWDC